MREMIEVTIDGKQAQVAKETTVLEAAKALGIEIPTFCHHDPVEPYGACRICIVEVDEGRGKKRIVPSCVFPIRGPLTVETQSPRVVRDRKMLAMLELARCSNHGPAKALAAKLGVTEVHPRLTKQQDDCILCGLCVRVCREVVGADALGFEGRGQHRRAVAPFDAENPKCIACGACAFVCPTQCIGLVDGGGERWLYRWHREVPLAELEKLALQQLPPGVASKKAAR
jgi:NADH dehydrogenase/NADH:ubiquinone oxidoreductase subunit G